MDKIHIRDFALRCIIGPDIPNNAGSLAPFTVTAPQGCILNARPPAPEPLGNARHRGLGIRGLEARTAPRFGLFENQHAAPVVSKLRSPRPIPAAGTQPRVQPSAASAAS